MSQEDVRVLGIDPGTLVTGWGVVTRTGASFRRVASGALELGSAKPLGERLGEIRSAVGMPERMFSASRGPMPDTDWRS